MGLDSFWVDSDGNEIQVEFKNPPKLCGGIFSANGVGSFRGKVYNEFVQSITGVSLYQEMIDNETIKEMADKLDEFVKNHDMELWDEDQAEDLALMFRVYADAGACLHGWW